MTGFLRGWSEDMRGGGAHTSTYREMDVRDEHEISSRNGDHITIEICRYEYPSDAETGQYCMKGSTVLALSDVRRSSTVTV